MKSGEFSLELINAETKEPMKEFTAPDGKVYVEAEPDLEYFIRCYRERGVREEKKVKRTTVRLRVDGTDLGFRKTFVTETGDLGLWKRQNGVDTHQSLRMTLKRTRGAAGSSSNTMPPVGSVNAVFQEVIYFDDMVERKLDRDKTHCLNQSSTSAPPAASGAKKAFASVSGSATSISANDNPKARWKKRKKLGRRLGEMTIYYTSALGLSQLGILGAPIVPVSADQATSNSSHDGGSSGISEPTRKKVKTEPARDSISSSTATRNNTHGDDGASGITEPKRKRVKTEHAKHDGVSPSRPQTDNLIDLTGDDDLGAQKDGLIDLTGDD